MKYFQFLVQKTAFLMLLLMLSAQFATAQGTQISWDDDDDEEEDVTLVDGGEDWDIGPGNHDQVMIRVNGEEFTLDDDITIGKKDTLDIKVRHLKPSTGVVLHMKKGGIKLKKTSFYANNKGQLDLEVRTGNKKIKGTAEIYYQSSSGKKHKREIRIAIE